MTTSTRDTMVREMQFAHHQPAKPASHRLSGRPAKYAPGYQFGQLTLLQRYGNRATLECSCGNVIEVSMTALTQGGKVDCGHMAAERDLDQAHERSNGMLYWTWRNMLNRCEDEHNPHFNSYGKRGIKVCERWHNYSTFANDLGERPEGTTLDRIDPNGDYEPTNVRWATPQEQARNKRNAS